jgi:NAD(P)-dependent dehydrogenase (short-subunit alcohol dehydrogenase family)
MGKVALVTGGAHPRGIGFGSAKALVALGYEVIVTGISAEEIALTPQEPGISTRILDVTSEESIAALFASIDRLDALVNSAGFGTYEMFQMDKFERTIEINLNGTMRVSLAAHPLLAQQGGAIVNIGSMYSIFGSTINPGYAASKGGVVALTKSCAAAWAKDGIRCNAVAPGWIRTNMARPMWEDPEQAQPIIDRTPMARWGEAEEVGDVVGFLCSPEARFVTGVLIPVDGGYSISG